MNSENFDLIVKERITTITLFAEALVYIVDVDDAFEENDLIVEKALSGILYDYIVEKYENAISNRLLLDDNIKRYLNPLFRIGFEQAKKEEHAKNNGLLNVVGVTFDIIWYWNDYIEIVQKEFKNK